MASSSNHATLGSFGSGNHAPVLDESSSGRHIAFASAHDLDLSASHVTARGQPTNRSAKGILSHDMHVPTRLSDDCVQALSEPISQADNDNILCHIVLIKLLARQGQSELITHVGMVFKHSDIQAADDSLHNIEDEASRCSEDLKLEYERRGSHASSVGVHSLTPMERFTKEPIPKSLISART